MTTAPPPARQRFNPRGRAAALPSSYTTTGDTTAEGREVGRRHVSTLMKKMGVAAIYRRPNISKPGPGHTIYPCLLRKGAWRDNVFVERLWRTVTYEEVYLRAYAGVAAARASIGRYLGFYNRKRPHSSLGGKTPDQAYIKLATPIPAAARNRRQITQKYPGRCSDKPSHLSSPVAAAGAFGHRASSATLSLQQHKARVDGLSGGAAAANPLDNQARCFGADEVARRSNG